MTIHIVLVHPKMPSNTGNIIRLCANTGAQLNLIKPLGFDMDDKKLRRAGLDYHEYANLQIHDNWQMCKHTLLEGHCHKIVALTTKQSRPFYEFNFLDSAPSSPVSTTPLTLPQTSQTASNPDSTNIALVFGSETAGLPEDIRSDIGRNNWLRLPMLPDSRSLNLSNTVAICLYEVWRQLGFYGDTGRSIGYNNLTPYAP